MNRRKFCRTAIALGVGSYTCHVMGGAADRVGELNSNIEPA